MKDCFISLKIYHSWALQLNKHMRGLRLEDFFYADKIAGTCSSIGLFNEVRLLNISGYLC